MSSSSDSDEDATERARLAQAVDPSFLKVANGGGTSNGGVGGDRRGDEGPASKRPKFTDDNDASAQPDFGKVYSLDVTPEGQKFIAKQLAKSLDKSLKEVDLPAQPPEESVTNLDRGIQLFASSKVHITANDFEVQKPSKTRKMSAKKKKKKSKKGSHSSDSSSDSESEKLKSVAVSADWVVNS